MTKLHSKVIPKTEKTKKKKGIDCLPAWHSVVGDESGWLDQPMIPGHHTTPLPNAAAHCSLWDGGSDADGTFGIFQDVTISVTLTLIFPWQNIGVFLSLETNIIISATITRAPEINWFVFVNLMLCVAPTPSADSGQLATISLQQCNRGKQWKVCGCPDFPGESPKVSTALLWCHARGLVCSNSHTLWQKGKGLEKL